MLVATVLLAAQAGADRRAVPRDARGTMPAPCNSNTLLNEFSDCHIGCGVHTHGDAVGSSCSTNFCGSDGICCRQGTNAGVCDGTVGCAGWHCCVCTTSSTHSPTGSPAIAIKGDPFTTYNNKRTQFYMENKLTTMLVECGSMKVNGRAIMSKVKNDDQQWFDMFNVQYEGKTIMTAAVRDGMTLVSQDMQVMKAGEQNDVSVDDDKKVEAALQRLRLVQSMALQGARSLTTLDVTMQSAPVLTTGTHILADNVNMTVTQDVSRNIGTGFVEDVNVESANFGVKFMSSVAGKFATDIDRVQNVHLDMSFTKINATQCTGPLPEIWGVRPMSRATARMLLPPASK